jgi:H+/gluconate symporter-like permease
VRLLIPVALVALLALVVGVIYYLKVTPVDERSPWLRVWTYTLNALGLALLVGGAGYAFERIIDLSTN